MKCYICGSEMKYREDLNFEIFKSGMIIRVTGLKGDLCEKCGERNYTEDSVGEIEEEIKKLEGFYIKFHNKLAKIKDEIVLQLPKELYTNMELKGDEEIDIIPLSKRKFIVSV
ncbi:MAG: YgiT-type zinc finger protein [Methanosarcinales archaeon]